MFDFFGGGDGGGDLGEVFFEILVSANNEEVDCNQLIIVCIDWFLWKDRIYKVVFFVLIKGKKELKKENE